MPAAGAEASLDPDPVGAGSPPAPPGPHGAGGRVVEVVRRPTAEDLDPSGVRRRRRRVERSLGIAVPILLLLAWQVSSDRSWIDPRFFPSPTRIWDAGVELVRDGELQTDLWVSTRRVLLGFAIGSIVGVLFAVLLQSSRLVRAALEPITIAFWTVPKLALVPMLFLIFGVGETPIILLIALNCFFLVLIPTLAAMVSVPLPYREVAMSLRFSRWQTFRHVTFPSALPQIIVALRLTAGASILVLVAVEFVENQGGLGHLIWNSWSLFLPERMYVGIVIVSVAGVVFTALVTAVGRRLTRWAPPG